MKTSIRSRPVSCYKDDGWMDERACGAPWKPERKLLDHVDCFPSQPKWTYRLETSVLDVKIPVAAPVPKPPLYSCSVITYTHIHTHNLFLFSSHSANFLPFLRVYYRRARTLVRLCSLVLDVNDAMGVDTVQQIRNPLFLDIKLRPLFSASKPLHTAILRAAVLCEQRVSEPPVKPSCNKRNRHCQVGLSHVKARARTHQNSRIQFQTRR